MGLLTKNDLLRQEKYYFLAALLTSKKRTYLSCAQSERDKPLVSSCFFDSIRQTFNLGTWGDKMRSSSLLAAQFYEGSKLGLGEFDKTVVTNISPLNAANILEKINIENFYRKRDYDCEYDCILGKDADIVKEMTNKFDDNKVYSPTMFERMDFAIQILSQICSVPRCDARSRS